MARLCHAEGANVVIHGKDEEDVRRVAGDLGERTLERADDLSDASSPKRLVQATIEAFGRLDALVNNAAMISRKDLDASDYALFDHDFAGNARAPLFLIKAALPYLSESKGNVLNIGSINSYWIFS